MCDVPKTVLLKYETLDSAAIHSYPAGSIEYHCFDVDSAGISTYVRGTYGSYAYFEGAVDPSASTRFNVNWYETSNDSLVSTSGAAALTYSSSFGTVVGPYWASGSSDLANSFDYWHAINGSQLVDDTTPTGASMILAKCLYPGINHVKDRDDVAALSNTISISGDSIQGQNTLCKMPAGPPGAWLGTYQFVMSENDGDDHEIGTYGTNPFAFWVRSGMGFVGTWHASTGPFAGEFGNNIYMVVADTSKTYIVGFFCEINATSLVRKACSDELYEVGTTNANPENCPATYRFDHSLDPLYEFASIGSAESDTDDQSDPLPLPVTLAILFGCLSGVLLVVVVVLLVTRPAGSNKVVAVA